MYHNLGLPATMFPFYSPIFNISCEMKYFGLPLKAILSLIAIQNSKQLKRVLTFSFLVFFVAIYFIPYPCFFSPCLKLLFLLSSFWQRSLQERLQNSIRVISVTVLTFLLTLPMEKNTTSHVDFAQGDTLVKIGFMKEEAVAALAFLFIARRKEQSYWHAMSMLPGEMLS